MLCWHRRARKTTLILNLLIRECVKNPKRVYGYISPTYKQAKSIIWRDPNMLDKYLPEGLVARKNESELFVEFTNKSILALKGADDPDSVRGMDFQGVGLDEWALIKREIWEEILRPIIAQDASRWAMFAFTPKGVNHAHEYWENALKWKGWHRSFLPVSTSGLLSEDELEQAKIEMTLPLYNQEMECSFVAREEKSMITSEMLEDLNSVQLLHAEIKRIVSCDPSEGGDACIIYALENSTILEKKKIYEHNQMIIAGEMVAMAYKHGIKNFDVDNIGIGKGIQDRLQEQGHNVVGIRSSEKAVDPEAFYNKRTEMWWHLANMIRQRLIDPLEDLELKRQLIAPKYDVVDSNGKIKLEPKKYTKETLGRSPDEADAYVMGIYAQQFINDSNATPRVVYVPSKFKPSAWRGRSKVSV